MGDNEDISTASNVRLCTLNVLRMVNTLILMV